jgi:methanogenic corrinoid protein MtbC1
MLKVYEELADCSKRRILVELLTGPKRVGQIVDSTGLKQANVSNHLAKMRGRNIVQFSKAGREVYYALYSGDIEEAIRSALETRAPCGPTNPCPQTIERFARAAIQGAEDECARIADPLIRPQPRLLDLYEGVLRPAMEKVGQWYSEGRIHVAQEHMASESVHRVLGRAAIGACREKENGLTALLGTAEGNQHVIGLRMAADLLYLNGWNTKYLGASVPEEDFLASVCECKPRLVLISCGYDAGLPPTASLVRALARGRSAGAQYRIAVGGGHFSRHPEAASLVALADCVFTDLRQFAAKLTEYSPCMGKSSLTF